MGMYRVISFVSQFRLEVKGLGVGGINVKIESVWEAKRTSDIN